MLLMNPGPRYWRYNAMPAYEVTYKVGRYENTIILQADSLDGVRTALSDQGLLPQGGEIISVKLRS
jgi:hypothetical protein